MPKVPKAKKKSLPTAKKMETPIELRDFACDLQDHVIRLRELANDLDKLWMLLHVRPLDSAGPITEGKDDIPF